MYRYKVSKYTTVSLLLIFLLFNTTALFAQQIVESSDQSAGFRFTTRSDVVEPVIHYHQNIHMLSSIPDKPSLDIFGDGRVVVHFPAYMKKAGDYEMWLDATELKNLIKALSSDGVLDFDEQRVKGKVDAHEKALRDKGQLYAISDSAETVVVVKLDEYQKNRRSKKIGNFRKEFKWKNIEHDAARYKNNTDLIRANNSMSLLKGLMNDARLIKMEQR